MKRLGAFLALLVAQISLISVPAHAGMCAMCRRTLEMTGNQGLIKGFLISILVIGGVPLAIASVAFFAFYSHRNTTAHTGNGPTSTSK